MARKEKGEGEERKKRDRQTENAYVPLIVHRERYGKQNFDSVASIGLIKIYN